MYLNLNHPYLRNVYISILPKHNNDPIHHQSIHNEIYTLNLSLHHVIYINPSSNFTCLTF
jgi:hypothetical protein